MENSLEISLTQKQYELIEKYGQLHAKDGMQLACGKIYGLLLVADVEELTFEQIVATLKISKSSASVAINNLLLFDRIEYSNHPGDRKRYFRVKEVPEEVIFSGVLKKLTSMNSLTKEILSTKADPDSRTSKLITRMRKVSKYFLNIMEEVTDDLKAGKDVFGLNE